MELTVIRYLPAKRWYIVPALKITQDSLHRKELGFHKNQQSIFFNKIDLKQQDIYYFDTINLGDEKICINQKDKPVIFYYSYQDKAVTEKVLQYYTNFMADSNKDQFGRLNRFAYDTAMIKILTSGDAFASLSADDIK